MTPPFFGGETFFKQNQNQTMSLKADTKRETESNDMWYGSSLVWHFSGLCHCGEVAIVERLK